MQFHICEDRKALKNEMNDTLSIIGEDGPASGDGFALAPDIRTACVEKRKPL